MKVAKDESVDFPLFVITDFFPNPEEIRYEVLQAPLRYDNGPWVGDNVNISDETRIKTMKYILSTAKDILKDYVWCFNISVPLEFRKLEDSSKTSEFIVHTDRFEWLDFDQQGRSLLSKWDHWSFVFDLTPTENAAKLSFGEYINGEKTLSCLLKHPNRGEIMRDASSWKFYKHHYYSYNSAVMFPSNYWHTASDFICSKQVPRVNGAAWFYSGYNPVYHISGIELLDKSFIR